MTAHAKHSLILSVVTSFVVTQLASRSVVAQPNDFSRLSLQQAIARALERNPIVVESALETRRAQGAQSGVAGILAENPVVGAEGGVRSDRGSFSNQPSLAVRVEQPLDLFGQAGTRQRAAADVVAWSKARLALARAEIAARTQMVYLAAQVASARVALDRERLSMARQTVEALQLRARLGASSDIDLGMAEAEAGRAEGALQGAQSLTTRTLLALRDLLELPAHAAALPSDTLTQPPLTLPERNGQENLLAHHLSVQAVEKRRLAIDSEIVRLERERLPRLSLGLAAERPSNQERFVGLAFSFSPALWRRNQGPLAEARIERERADFEQSTTLAGLERRWVALHEEQSLRLQELKSVERTLEKEEAIRSLVRTGWQAGKFDFLRLLLAERSVADTKQARLDLWTELWTNVIEMNRLLGQEP
jgi:outer membrane protein TolC